jgi:two-component system, NtrC family, sensor kinase
LESQREWTIISSLEVTMSGASGEEPDEAERLKELGHLSAAVGHHVINAFSAVVSNAELIRAHATDPATELSELSALGSAIIENALSASHIPRRLIDWTRRFTSPGFDQSADPAVLIDLNQLIRETVEAQVNRDGSSVEWILQLKPIPAIRGSASQLRSLLGYLLQNAREAMPRGSGRVTFTTQVDTRNWVILEVRDSGSGMLPDVLRRATEPFFTTKPGHSGVGLTVAHGIWRRHRGALSIESKPGEGTMIRLAVEAPSAPAPPPRVEPTLSRSERLLPTGPTVAQPIARPVPEQSPGEDQTGASAGS